MKEGCLDHQVKEEEGIAQLFSINCHLQLIHGALVSPCIVSWKC